MYNNRSSLYPSNYHQPQAFPQQGNPQPRARRRTTIAPSTLKTRQLSHLHSQLAQLQANMSDLDNLIKLTAVRAEAIRKIGLLHGSLFMASHRVFEDEALRGTNKEEEDDDDNNQNNNEMHIE